MSRELVEFASETTRSQGYAPAWIAKPGYLILAAALAVMLCLSIYLVDLFDMDRGSALLQNPAYKLASFFFRPVLVVIAALATGYALNGHSLIVGRMTSVVVAFFLTIALLNGAFNAAEATSFNSDWMRLKLHQSDYMKQVASLSQEGRQPCFTVWPWGHTGADDSSGTFYFVVYDSADQILEPYTRRTSEWRGRAGQWGNVYSNPSDTTPVTIKPLEGHFYSISLSQ